MREGLPRLLWHSARRSGSRVGIRVNGLGRSGCVAAVLALVMGCASSDTPSAEPQAEVSPTTSLVTTTANPSTTPPETTAAATSSGVTDGEVAHEGGCPPVGVIADIAKAIAEAVAASQAVAEDHAADVTGLIEAWETFNPRSLESLEMLESVAPDPDGNHQALLAETERAAAHVSTVVDAAAETYSTLDESNRQASEILAAVADDSVDDLGELSPSVARALFAYESAVASALAAEFVRADAQAVHSQAMQQSPGTHTARVALVDFLRAGIAASEAQDEAFQAFFALYNEVLWATLNERCS